MHKNPATFAYNVDRVTATDLCCTLPSRGVRRRPVGPLVVRPTSSLPEPEANSVDEVDAEPLFLRPAFIDMLNKTPPT